MAMAPGPLPEKAIGKIATKFSYESEWLLTGVVTPRFFSAYSPGRTIKWGAQCHVNKAKKQEGQIKYFRI
jgi:hypothetical protein